MSHLNFKPVLADLDVWLRPVVKSDGSEYYEYVLFNTCELLVFNENAEWIFINEIRKYFELKEDPIGPTQMNLGDSARKVVLENSVEAWAFSSSQHAKATVNNAEICLK